MREFLNKNSRNILITAAIMIAVGVIGMFGYSVVRTFSAIDGLTKANGELEKIRSEMEEFEQRSKDIVKEEKKLECYSLKQGKIQCLAKLEAND